MRTFPAFRLLAALLAFIAALSSPAVSLAHGEAHEHLVSAHGAPPHRTTIADALDAGAGSRAVDHLSAESDEPHAGLHVEYLARMAAPFATALVASPADLIVAAAESRGSHDAAPPAVLSPPGRAAPPDQPRAPPAV